MYPFSIFMHFDPCEHKFPGKNLNKTSIDRNKSRLYGTNLIFFIHSPSGHISPETREINVIVVDKTKKMNEVISFLCI